MICLKSLGEGTKGTDVRTYVSVCLGGYTLDNDGRLITITLRISRRGNIQGSPAPGTEPDEKYLSTEVRR